jgi:plasmid stabilization system protein ParE
MRVKWSERARKQRDEVANYIRQQFGAKRKYKFKQEIRETTDLLKRSPGIGQIDPLFEDRPQTYRCIIINGLNKLVYRVEDDTIYIAGFWDTRMDDEDQATSVK